MISIDEFLGKVRKKNYNCADFAAEVWERLTEKPAKYLVEDWCIESRSRLQRLNKPIDPCIVIFYQRKLTPHVGIFIRGRVLHLTDVGVEYQPINVTSRTFRNYRFYIPR